MYRFLKLLYGTHFVGKTLQACLLQLILLLLCLLFVPAFLFSAALFFIEQKFGTDESKIQFGDMFESLWWSIVTMTTIGYGNVVPGSSLGRMVGGVAAVFGVIILSFTTSILGSNFNRYYNVARTQIAALSLKSDQTCVKAENIDKTTLMEMVNQHKSESIRSDTSKDSGYGPSPLSPASVQKNLHSQSKACELEKLASILSRSEAEPAGGEQIDYQCDNVTAATRARYYQCDNVTSATRTRCRVNRSVTFTADSYTDSERLLED